MLIRTTTNNNARSPLSQLSPPNLPHHTTPHHTKSHLNPTPPKAKRSLFASTSYILYRSTSVYQILTFSDFFRTKNTNTMLSLSFVYCVTASPFFAFFCPYDDMTESDRLCCVPPSSFPDSTTRFNKKQKAVDLLSTTEKGTFATNNHLCYQDRAQYR